jgi:hypothetical protein
MITRDEVIEFFRSYHDEENPLSVCDKLELLRTIASTENEYLENLIIQACDKWEEDSFNDNATN